MGEKKKKNWRRGENLKKNREEYIYREFFFLKGKKIGDGKLGARGGRKRNCRKTNQRYIFFLRGRGGGMPGSFFFKGKRERGKGGVYKYLLIQNISFFSYLFLSSI